MRRFAFQGGTPAFSELKHVGQPDTSNYEEFLAKVDRIMKSRWLTNDGPCVKELEAAIAAAHRVRNCILLANGTLAIQIAIRAMELKGEVILPAFTFVATAHAVEWQGATPVFCDVEPEYLTIDPTSAAALVTDRTSAILGVHVFSNPCDHPALERIATERGVGLFYDSAHCFGASMNDRPFGGGGRLEIMSFHATKIFTTFEGGAILTDDDEIAGRVRLARNFGFRDYDDVVGLGINAKLPEVSAAWGLATLGRVPGVIEMNRQKRGAYTEAIASIPGLTFLGVRPGTESNCQYVALIIDEKRAGFSRDALYRLLWAENIRARRYFYPCCHRVEPYRSRSAHPLPVTDRMAQRVLCLPTGSCVSQDDVATIASVIRDAADRAGEVEAWWRNSKGDFPEGRMGR